MEGYVPASLLRMVKPSTEYGLLVDKVSQTMVVYEHGKRIGTMKISTGKPVKRDLTRETAAGSFLTVSRIGAFTMKGYAYANPIRYDGGNLIHSIGWRTVNKKRDYSMEQALLGQKASHACIRLPRFGEEGELTSWWLWQRIPWHTRIIILDDPEARQREAELLGVPFTDMPYTGGAAADQGSQ